MNEIPGFFDRSSLKGSFKRRFGDMLETEELRRMLGKNADISELSSTGQLIVVWPGENKPVFPYFQLNKGRLRPQIALVQAAISQTSDNAFYSPIMLCEWFFRRIEGKKVTPLELMKKGKDKQLIKEAEKFGRRLHPRVSIMNQS